MVIECNAVRLSAFVNGEWINNGFGAEHDLLYNCDQL
jgi:hypothetical protein